MAICFAERPADLGYRAVTESRIWIGAREVRYRTECADILLKTTEGREIGCVFGIACMAENEGSEAGRPLMMIFNGGPGSSSAWLEMGFLGPRLGVPDEAGMPRREGPWALRDNPDCLLDLCDLLFYHPPGAGYSRLFDEKDADRVFGDHGDADAAEMFLRTWLKAHGREQSPLYILGESFGSTRASLLADRVSDLNLRGILHVGPGYTGDSNIPRTLKDLVPCAATRWYYDPDPERGTLEETVAKARRFLRETYLPALYAGTALPLADRKKIAEALAEMTGLPAAYYLENGLRVNRAEFRDMLLAEQGLKIGSFDTRFTLPKGESEDPTLAALDPFISGSLELYFDEVMPCRPKRAWRDNSFDETDSFLWPFNAEEDMEGLGGHWYPMRKTVGASVRDAAAARPKLRIFFATGYFDTVATVENTRFAITHTEIPFERITMKEYASGHAVYADDRSRHQLAEDVRTFLEETERGV